MAETASGEHFYDKEFIAADWRAGHSEAYITFTDFQAQASCKRSFNRGGFCASPIMLSKWTATAGAWSTPIEISGHSALCVGGETFSNKQANADACNFDQGSFPVVMPDGSVYVVFNNFNTLTLVDQQLGVHVSADLATVGAPVRVGFDDESHAALCDFGRGPEQCVDSLNIRSQDFPDHRAVRHRRLRKLRRRSDVVGSDRHRNGPHADGNGHLQPAVGRDHRTEREGRGQHVPGEHRLARRRCG